MSQYGTLRHSPHLTEKGWVSHLESVMKITFYNYENHPVAHSESRKNSHKIGCPYLPNQFTNEFLFHWTLLPTGGYITPQNPRKPVFAPPLLKSCTCLFQYPPNTPAGGRNNINLSGCRLSILPWAGPESAAIWCVGGMKTKRFWLSEWPSFSYNVSFNKMKNNFTVWVKIMRDFHKLGIVLCVWILCFSH